MNEFTIRSNGSQYVIVNSKTFQEWGFTVEYLKESDMGMVASKIKKNIDVRNLIFKIIVKESKNHPEWLI